MPKKINYELMMFASSLGDYRRQEEIIKSFRCDMLTSNEGKLLYEVVKKSVSDYQNSDIDKLLQYASYISNDTKHNTECINAINQLVDIELKTDKTDEAFVKYKDICLKHSKDEKIKEIVKKANIAISNGDFDNAINKLDIEQFKEEMKLRTYKNEKAKMADVLLQLDNDYQPDKGDGVITGVPVFDDCFGKIKRNEMLVLGGQSGAGKSLISTNIFAKLIHENRNVIYVALEMAFDNTFHRLASIIMGINPKFFRGVITDENEIIKNMKDTMDFVEIMGKRNNWSILGINEMKNGNIDDVLATCKAVAKEKKWSKIDCIILDYLQFMPKSDYRMTEFEAMKDNIQKLKAFVVGEEIPMIVISSLNADGNLKGATDIMYTGDFVAMISNDARNKDVKHLDIVKNRYGRFGHTLVRYNDTLQLQSNPTTYE